MAAMFAVPWGINYGKNESNVVEGRREWFSISTCLHRIAEVHGGNS